VGSSKYAYFRVSLLLFIPFFFAKIYRKKNSIFFLFYEKLRKGLFDIKVFFVFFIEKSSSLESLFKSFLKDVCYDLIL
jgi:hypothetical protein